MATKKNTDQPKASARAPKKKRSARASSKESAPKTSSKKKSGETSAKASRAKKTKKKSRRAVLVAGVRTPFVKAFGSFLKMDTIALGASAVAGLLERSGVPAQEVDSLVWGGVVIPSVAPNIGREIVLDLGLPPSIEAMTVTRACTSGLQAVSLAVASIERGDADVVIAGGSDSTSNAEVQLPQRAVHAMAPIAFGKAKSAKDYLGVIAQLHPIGGLLPKMPKIAERSTGEVMGESAERMAGRNGIDRESQDAFALRSHQRAAAAIASGRFEDEIVPVTTPEGKTIFADDIVRGDTSLEKLGKIRPAFAKDGTVTAGNASPLTDGAAATLWMSEEKAAELGLTPLAFLSASSYVGVDPSDQLLIGPAVAIPKVLDKAGLSLGDMDLVDLHEAFAAQVLSVTHAMESDGFAKEVLGRDAASGSIPPEKFNVHGGSIALGHPFAATGVRMVTTMANELKQTGAKRALLGICAAGGLGAAAILESV
ncbi:MAG: acetyl-CoA C-acyltransferase [Polyangiales bacterium]